MPADSSGVTFRQLINQRYPDLDIRHFHHAGSSSGVVDGAAALLMASGRYAREHGLKAMKLETGTLQPEALGLFARSGFSPCGPYADYPTDDPYSVFMEKPVA